ncbi:MAG: amidohydrolase family protein [Thaumarchaeota archaeon]|nr:amidohydrolase family protein [Nitrososphaerota archaeon]
MDILIKNIAYLITVNPQRQIIADGAMAIEGGVIAAVGKTHDVLKKYPSADKVIDGHNNVVTPGFINTHIHTASHFGRGIADNAPMGTVVRERMYPLEAALNPSELQLSTSLCILELLKNGVTCIADPGPAFGNAYPLVGAVEKSGTRAVIAENLTDFPPGKASERSPALTDEMVKKGQSFVKKFNGAASGRVKAWFSLRAESSVSSELASEIKRLADAENVGIQSHVSASTESLENHKARFSGKLPISRYHEAGVLGPNLLIAHGSWLTEGEIELMIEKNVKVSVTPTTNFALGHGGLKAARFDDMMRRGVVLSLGCSGSIASNFLDMIRVAYGLAAFRDARTNTELYPPETLLEMLTTNGAKALLLEDQVGSIELGKRADIVLFDVKRPEWVPLLNPVSNLLHSACGDSVATVIVDGEILMENRQVKTLNEPELLEEGQRVAEGIIQRAGLQRFAQPRWRII